MAQVFGRKNIFLSIFLRVTKIQGVQTKNKKNNIFTGFFPKPVPNSGQANPFSPSVSNVPLPITAFQKGSFGQNSAVFRNIFFQKDNTCFWVIIRINPESFRKCRLSNPLTYNGIDRSRFSRSGEEYIFQSRFIPPITSPRKREMLPGWKEKKIVNFFPLPITGVGNRVFEMKKWKLVFIFQTDPIDDAQIKDQRCKTCW